MKKRTSLLLLLSLTWLTAHAQLCKLNNEFNQAQTLQQAGWLNLNQTEGWNAEQLQTLDINQTEPGNLVMTPYSCAWFGDLRGPFLFKEVSGDFIFTTQVRITGRGDNDPPHFPFSLAGCMVRRPKTITHGDTDWAAGQENYVFLSIGFGDAGMCVDNNPADAISCGGANPTHLEVKATKNSSSNLQITPIGVQTITLRLAKIGNQIITMYQVPGQPFQVRRRYTIGAASDVILGNDVQVGLVAYTDWQKVSKYNNSLQNRRFHNRTVLNAASNAIPGNPDVGTPLNPDVVSRFDYARFNEVPQSLAGADLAALSDAALAASERLGFPSQASNCNICPPKPNAANSYFSLKNIAENAGDAKTISMKNGLFATPLTTSNGKVSLATWRTAQDGNITKGRTATEAGFRLTKRLEVAKLTDNSLVVAVQPARGDMKLIAWQVDDNGNISLLGTGKASAASSLAICGLSKNWFATAAKNASGKLELTTFEMDTQNKTIKKLGTIAGGDVGEVSIINAGNGVVVTAVKTSDNRLKLIAWKVNSKGTMTRLFDSGNQPETINRVALAVVADGVLVSASTAQTGNRLKLITWELTSTQILRRIESDGEAAVNFTLHTQPATHESGAAVYIGSQSAPKAANVAIWCILAGNFNLESIGNVKPPPSAVSDWGNFQWLQTTYLPERNSVLGTVKDSEGNIRFITWK